MLKSDRRIDDRDFFPEKGTENIGKFENVVEIKRSFKSLTRIL